MAISGALAESVSGEVDPMGLDSGGEVFQSDPGSEGDNPTGWSETAHSQYWDPSSKSLIGMGKVIAGHKP